MALVTNHEIEFRSTQGELDELKDCLYAVPWTSWEADFIETLSEDWEDLSPRQKFKVHELYDKLVDELLPMKHTMDKND